MEKKSLQTLTLTIRQAAELAGVSTPTLLSWTAQPDFPGFRSGRRWIIPRSSLEAWLEARAAERAVLR